MKCPKSCKKGVGNSSCKSEQDPEEVQAPAEKKLEWMSDMIFDPYSEVGTHSKENSTGQYKT